MQRFHRDRPALPREVERESIFLRGEAGACVVPVRSLPGWWNW